jgi:hypothetical protein
VPFDEHQPAYEESEMSSRRSAEPSESRRCSDDSSPGAIGRAAAHSLAEGFRATEPSQASLAALTAPSQKVGASLAEAFRVSGLTQASLAEAFRVSGQTQAPLAEAFRVSGLTQAPLAEAFRVSGQTQASLAALVAPSQKVGASLADRAGSVELTSGDEPVKPDLVILLHEAKRLGIRPTIADPVVRSLVVGFSCAIAGLKVLEWSLRHPEVASVVFTIVAIVQLAFWIARHIAMWLEP